MLVMSPPTYVLRGSALLLGVAFAVSTFGWAAPVPAERAKAERELVAMGTKLHGTWIGGPCEGHLTFRADGTYAWKHRGPAGFSEAGTWAIRGEPSAPVLIMKCKKSTHEDRIGTTVEMKLNRVDETGCVFTYPETSTPKRFESAKKPRVP